MPEDLKCPKPVKTKCIEAGGYWYTLHEEDIYGRHYHSAEVYHLGRLVHCLGNYETQTLAIMAVLREYPDANRAPDDYLT